MASFLRGCHEPSIFNSIEIDIYQIDGLFITQKLSKYIMMFAIIAACLRHSLVSIGTKTLKFVFKKKSDPFAHNNENVHASLFARMKPLTEIS